MSSVSRTVLREQVKDILLQRIVRGELQPGERLVETRIAQELGTSQAPVREALRDLELLRLVESEPFRGSRVRAFGDQDLVEVYPVRAALDEVAARAAAVNLAGDVGALEAELEAMRVTAREGDVHAFVEHDFAFHSSIVDAADIDILSQCWRLLGVEGRIALTLYVTFIDPTEVAELHTPILEALRSGKAGLAGREARKHVEFFARLLSKRKQVSD